MSFNIPDVSRINLGEEVAEVVAPSPTSFLTLLLWNATTTDRQCSTLDLCGLEAWFWVDSMVVRKESKLHRLEVRESWSTVL